MTPHSPWAVPEEYWQWFKDLPVDRRATLVDEAAMAEADRLRREQGLPLATALVRAGAATERAVAMAVATQKPVASQVGTTGPDGVVRVEFSPPALATVSVAV